MKRCYLKNHSFGFSGSTNWARLLSVAILISMYLCVPVFASAETNSADEVQNKQQAKHSIKGNVTDENGDPLPGVTVVLKGTTVGTITDFDGNYQLAVDDATGTLVFRFVGMETNEVAIEGQTEINVVLGSEALAVDEVVVTALGIKREKKALGYAVQDVKGEDLNLTGDANVTNALQGKVAGVQISSAGGLGGSPRIEIRGASSLSDNNKPLWVIDGIPFSDEDSDDPDDVWGGVSRGGGALDINPDDIESISVLKGPNAAALYGSRAGNGVILVTTKKGTKKTGLGISYSGNVTISEAAYSLDLQDEFGQGEGGVYDKSSSSSWGPRFDGQLRDSWVKDSDGSFIQLPYEAASDKLEDFTQTGVSQKHHIAFTGGNEEGSYRVSMGKEFNEGIYSRHKTEKLNFDLHADYDINKWLNVDTKVSYINAEGQERPEMGYYSFVSMFNTMPANIRTQDLRPGYVIEGGEHKEVLYTVPGPNARNPYYQQAQMSNNDERFRTFGYFASNINFTDELKLRLKYGLDYYRYETEQRYLYADNVNPNRPDYETSEKFFKEENYEFLLSYNKDLNNDFTLGLNVGGNRMNRNWDKLSAKSGLLISEQYSFLGYGTNITAEEEFEEYEIQSIYGFGQLGYKNMVYLDVTARNDWSSALPNGDNSYFYPSFSLSGIVSDMTEMPSWINFAKVRTSWAQVGKDTDPYETNQVYTIGQWNFNLKDSEIPETLVNADLKPEISSSYEVGFDVRLLNNRIGVDFTYYNERTKNQILGIAIDQTTGFEKRLINAGLIVNEGIEVMVNTTPVKTKDFRLDVDFNFAKNKTMVEELDENLKRYDFFDDRGIAVVGIEGEKMGDILGSVYERDANGTIIVDADGLPKRAEERQVIGNIQPDWTGSVNFHADYKGLYMTALVDIKQGGDIVSLSEIIAASSGTAARTAENGRMAFFYDGVTEAGGVNNEIISSEQYWQRVAGIQEEFVYDASYMKLKEFAVGYNIPKNLLNKISNNPIKNARVAFVGRNLFYFYKDTPGTAPDASAFSSAYEAQAMDFSPIPLTRTYGFSLNLGF